MSDHMTGLMAREHFRAVVEELRITAADPQRKAARTAALVIVSLHIMAVVAMAVFAW